MEKLQVDIPVVGTVDIVEIVLGIDKRGGQRGFLELGLAFGTAFLQVLQSPVVGYRMQALHLVVVLVRLLERLAVRCLLVEQV